MDGAVDGAVDGASEKGLNGAPGRLSGGNNPLGKALEGVLDPVSRDCRSPLTMEKAAVPKHPQPSATTKAWLLLYTQPFKNANCRFPNTRCEILLKMPNAYHRAFLPPFPAACQTEFSPPPHRERSAFKIHLQDPSQHFQQSVL